MESPSNLAAALLAAESSSSDRLRVRKETLEALLHHCQRALETIPDSDDAAQSAPTAAASVEDPAEANSSTVPSVADSEVDVVSPDFVYFLFFIFIPLDRPILLGFRLYYCFVHVWDFNIYFDVR